LSAKQKFESQQILSLQIRLVLSRKRTVHQRFFNQQVCLFSFFTMAANDRGYGLGRAAGEFPVAPATKEMRAQRLQKAHQPPKAHRRVLGVRSVFVVFVSAV
jgi:hypothetical protein